MVSFPAPFVPYELILLIGVVALFFVIYRYLSNSLPTKKEELAKTIEIGYDREIQNYQGRLYPVLSDQEFRARYQEIISNFLYEQNKFDFHNPNEGIDDAIKSFFKLLSSFDKRTEFSFRKQEVIDNFYLIIYTYRLKALSENIRTKQLEKFRLRDLEKIYDNPPLIDAIYEKRTQKKGSSK